MERLNTIYSTVRKSTEEKPKEEKQSLFSGSKILDNHDEKIFSLPTQSESKPTTNFMKLPDNLLEPSYEGSFEHLISMQIPSLELHTTNNKTVNLSTTKVAIVFCYPRTGQPEVSLPEGWLEIPGAFGCTSQACSFKHIQLEEIEKELAVKKIDIFGLSTQTPEYQLEAARRLELDYPLISYNEYTRENPLKLPFLTHNNENVIIDDMVLLKRGTLIVVNGIIRGVIDPDFPPNKSAERAINWIAENMQNISSWLTV